MSNKAVTRAPIAALLSLLRVPTDQPELLQAQLKALSKLMPLLFFILIVNTLAVGYTHYGVAPDIMTIGFPLLVTIGYSLRGWTFLKAGRRAMSNADAVHLLRATSLIAPVSSAVIVFWALVIFRYGDAYAQGHVVFYLGITVIDRKRTRL